ncbi:lytic transglycosylase domain-containing protein [Fluviicola chungangensis]|uniref:Lytic transglycosylase domain-containing protein n=1 Tax=Fluviicola chungangensis TaxID=2597671 RepID=A0A556N0G9_9FLAO|nr:lytic transglycosylase domain-containing protein [Fluviicola chungangensis]TSJ45575.1 lytic transglycosylase domain-containing protein [Fluviicola chungangensis]
MNKIFLLFIVGLLASCRSETIERKKEAKHKEVLASSAVIFPDLPQSMEFAGTTINLQDEDLRERLDREVLITAYYQSAWIGAIKRAHRYFPEIERILKEEGVPDDFKYLAIIESNLQQAVSPVGAQGFWQFMPATAKLYNLEMNAEIDERLNIEKSTRAACRYLKDAYRTLNDWVMTTAAYNRGVGGVIEDMEWQKTEHYFDTYQNSETGRYVFRLLATKLIYENPEAYGFYPEKMELYEPFHIQKVIVEESIPNLALWANDQGINIKILRKLNPWLKTTKLTVKKGAKFTLLLPAASENLKPYGAYK